MDIAKNLAENISSAQSFTLPDLVIKNVSYLNVFTESFEKADIAVKNGVIVGVGEYEGVNEIDGEGKTLVPGFIDGHTHLESSVISPKQYCKAVVPHGTVAVVTDPHEITNVLGKTGFDYIYEETKNLPLDVYLMVPSCVPATPFDESGADLTIEDMEEMLSRPRVLGLAEMMNFPGVIYGDKNVIAKLELAKKHAKLIDGHAPALSGKQLSAYVGAGIGTDHECVNEAEAVEKIALGQYIMIREGTAGKNLEGLKGLFKRPYCHRCMLATDDKHPGELSLDGHIDYIIRRAISLGADPVCAYKMASYNAAAYFGFKTKGAIAPGFEADFVLLDDVNIVKINSVYKAGVRIDNRVGELVDAIDEENPHRAQAYDTVHIVPVTADSFKITKDKEKVIGLIPQQILTTDEGETSEVDVEKDICKLSVIERHHATGHMASAYLKGYGLKSGAVATSIAHDSHNIIVVGTNDEDMALAVNYLSEIHGGMVVVENGEVLAELSLPIGGIMCDLDTASAEKGLYLVKRAAYRLGVFENIDPFMTLSFASLAVIPTLRLTTKGVVDVRKFELLD